MAKVSDKGFYLTNYVEAHDEKLADALVEFLRSKQCSFVYDLGCGVAHRYVDNFQMHGMLSHGFDGNPHLKGQHVTIADLTTIRIPPQMRPSWVICLEVGEHVPKAHELAFLNSISAIPTKGIVLSWAIPGQAGYHHVNCRSNEYIICEMMKRGYKHDPAASQWLRDQSSMWWFKNTIMVFNREVR